jgi:glucokinase
MRKRSAGDFVLAGDIGGTNARLRLYDGQGLAIMHEAVLPSREAPSLESVVGKYLARRKVRVGAAVLAVAGPVVDGVAHTTNLPWVVDERVLARDLDIPRVALVNDLAAAAIGCTRAARESRVVLARGHAPRAANIAVIAAGTGLGEALLVWDRDHFVPCATEGGHADFAPTSAIEVELLEFLQKTLGIDHVSYERVLSGPGIGHVYDFFVERFGETAANRRKLKAADRHPIISALGLAGDSFAAAQAIELFAHVYGAEAGNLALKGLALGGVYLCGRMAAEILPPRKAAFLFGLRTKGRMAELLARIPVTIVTDSFVGLTGAGYLAARLAAS